MEARSTQYFLSRRLATYQNLGNRRAKREPLPDLHRRNSRGEQRDAQAASLRSNTARCDADVAARMAAQHDACLQLAPYSDLASVLQDRDLLALTDLLPSQRKCTDYGLPAESCN